MRKLPQPSVSPAAPHPEQALLGAAEIIKKESFLRCTYIDEYGNTRYTDNVFYTLFENNIEENTVQQF